MTPLTRAPRPAEGAVPIFIGPMRSLIEAVVYSTDIEFKGSVGEREDDGGSEAHRVFELAKIAIQEWGKSGKQPLDIYVDSENAAKLLNSEFAESGEAIHIHHISKRDNVVRQLPPFIGRRNQVPNRIDWLGPIDDSG